MTTTDKQQTLLQVVMPYFEHTTQVSSRY